NDGTLKAGESVTLNITFSEAVTFAGGTPTLTLDTGATANYTSGNGTTTLVFTYTVGSGETSSDLTITSFNLSPATLQDNAGNNANLAGAATNPATTLVVDTTAPNAPSISQVSDNVGIIQGNVSNSGSTDDTTPTVRVSLSGTNAVANDTVQLFNGATPIGSPLTLTIGD